MKRTCVFCGYEGVFLNCGTDNIVFNSKKNVACAGYRHEVLCPKCGTNDRIRFVDYVLAKYTDVYTGKNRVLHIAPEPCVREKIRCNNLCDYTDGDIIEGVASNIVDVTEMKFEDESFDYIIINHVLEHIRDDGKAIHELMRCLKKNGRIIFSFPIALDANTEEDINATPEERADNYGWELHLRLYGENDLAERMSKYGLSFNTVRITDEMSEAEIESGCFLRSDRIFIGRHSNATNTKS